jgi:hypothetical protein
MRNCDRNDQKKSRKLKGNRNDERNFGIAA